MTRHAELKQRIERAIRAAGDPPDEILAETGYVGAAVLGLLSAAVVSVPGTFLRRSVFIAVTRSQVICYRVTRWRGQPWSVQESFRAPLSAVYINGSARRGRRSWSMTFKVHQRGVARGTAPTLTIAPAWLGDLDEVLRATKDAGPELATP